MTPTLFETQTAKTPDRPRFPLLYTLDSKGKLRSWQIAVEPREKGFAVVTLFGLVEGSKVPNEYLVSEGKNIGRANQTSAFEQAVFEAQSKWNLQIKAGYCVNPADCRQDTLGSGIPAPMLAQKYSPDGSLSGSKSLEKMKIPGQKIHVQPKLDGIRCLARINPRTVELYTRKGDRLLPIPHIEEQLRESYTLADLTDEIILDGELYTDSMTFNALSGLLRRESKSVEDFKLLNNVGYYLYDIVDSTRNYAERHAFFSNLYNADVNIVPSFEIEATDAGIRGKMETFLANGYEGLMIRRLDMPYENKRSWGLCKYKDFQDAEYRLADIIEDVRGNGIIGAFVLEIEVGGERKTFNAGIKDLSHDESRKILANKSDYIGRMATVEFFQLSEYGCPRFPKLKGFRSDV